MSLHKLQHYGWIQDTVTIHMTTGHYEIIEEIELPTDSLTEIMEQCRILIVDKGWKDVRIKGPRYAFTINFVDVVTMDKG